MKAAVTKAQLGKKMFDKQAAFLFSKVGFYASWSWDLPMELLEMDCSSLDAGLVNWGIDFRTVMVFCSIVLLFSESVVFWPFCS